MLTARLKERVPSAKAIGIGQLSSCVLRWHKRGRDGSGKCDLERTRSREDGVWGVIFELNAADKPALDRAEGLGKGCVERRVDVVTDHGVVRALVYVATARDLRLKPYHWYKDIVIAGAREHGLPKEYIELLETTPSSRDPDEARAAKNESLLAAESMAIRASTAASGPPK